MRVENESGERLKLMKTRIHTYTDREKEIESESKREK